jgi:hypothetical protein
MAKDGFNFLKQEASLIGEAAQRLVKGSTSGVTESLRQAGVAFKGETTSTKLTIVGGITTGVTFGLTGVRNIQAGLTKRENGKRNVGQVALGVVEAAGGAFVTALFWERLKANGGMYGARTADKGPSR